MWPPPPRPETKPEHTAPRRRRFSTFSTFKDVENLLREDQNHRSLILRHNKKLLLPSIFNRLRISTSFLRALSSSDPKPDHNNNDADIVDVVVYFTSLRVVRRTFEDCRTVRSFRVPIDERDVSMDSSFLQEIQEIFGTEKVSLPRVFIGGRCVGGVEEVRQLHECGELKKLIGRFPIGSLQGNCEVCDDNTFILCEKCDGSHKVYVEKLGFRSCSDCNLNVLIRCPICFAPRTSFKSETTPK